MITKEQKKEIVVRFGNDARNTGDEKVQVALLTARINDLQGHFKANPKDHASRRGLLKLVGQRRRLLKYIKNRNIDEYRALIADLGRDLACGISNLISLFNPSLVVVGGTGVNLGPAFLDSVRTALAGMGFPAFVSRVRVEYSRLGLDAELTGAAQYYIDTHYDFSGNTQQRLFLR